MLLTSYHFYSIIESKERKKSATFETYDHVQGRLPLDVIILGLPAVLQALASEYEPHTYRVDACPVLDAVLDIVDGVVWLVINSNSFASQFQDKKLSPTEECCAHLNRGKLCHPIVSQRFLLVA